jgi:hypothetical protein
MGKRPTHTSPCRLREKTEPEEKHSRMASDDISDVQARWLQAGHLLATSNSIEIAPWLIGVR